MKYLITGGTGILGTELKKLFPESLCPTHSQLDITNKENVLDYFTKNDFDLIIHTAAITSIRKCESEKKLAWETNVVGTENLVGATTNLKPNLKFLHLSTACVFDGQTGMYKESSIPHPENFYALTKLISEQSIKKIKNSIIIRTNFVGKQKWMYPRAFSDRYGTYLFAGNVAFGIKEILDDEVDGTIHIVGDKKLSMYDLAQITTPSVKPMTIDEYDGPSLTMDMSLDTERWKKYKIE